MRVVLGADHGGWKTKEMLKLFLDNKGYEVVDVGNDRLDVDDDYVDFSEKGVEEMKAGDRLILICRNGMGMAVVANKKRGVRCGLGFGPEAVRKGRQDDDINALALPADYSTDEGIKEMVRIFLSEEFKNTDRYSNRLKKLSILEDKWLK